MFILLNILIAIHSYSFTHFEEDAPPLGVDNLEISFPQKMQFALLGVDLPKPKTPNSIGEYDKILIPVVEGDSLAAWYIKTDSEKRGIVLMFHGFREEKSAMLPRAREILKMGYNVLLVDFMGSGESYGNQSTFGYLEAENVTAVYDYISELLEPEEKIYMLGFSMGAAAIMKALHDKPMKVDGVILEAPYSSFKTTVANRVDLLGVLNEPTTSLFTFWIGVVNNYNAFEMNPIEYAKSIAVPILHMSGMEDQYISVDEAKSIFNALGSKDKKLYLFEESKHESYLLKHHQKWCELVSEFLLKGN